MNASDIVTRITEYFDKEGLAYSYNDEIMRFDYGFCIDNEVIQAIYVNAMIQAVRGNGLRFCLHPVVNFIDVCNIKTNCSRD